MPSEKKSKKQDIEKLRMILDNPGDDKVISEDETHLDSIRKRLMGETSKGENRYKMSEASVKKSNPLQPSVTIYQREEKPMKSEKQASPPVIEQRYDVKEQKQVEDWRDVNDLYDIEKVVVEEPIFLEVKPKEIPKKKSAERIEPLPLSKEEEKLPEWEPVDHSNISKPEELPVKISEPAEKPRKEEKLPEWQSADQDTASKTMELPAEQPASAEITHEPTEILPTSDEKKEEELPIWKPIDHKEQNKTEIVPTETFEPIEEPREPEEKIAESKIIEPAEEKEEEFPAWQPPERKETVQREDPELQKRKEEAIAVFKSIHSIDEITAVSLYDHGFTSIDKLKVATVKDLRKMAGIKRRRARKIKKEIDTMEKPTEKKEIQRVTTKKKVPKKTKGGKPSIPTDQDIYQIEIQKMEKKAASEQKTQQTTTEKVGTEWDTYDVDDEEPPGLKSEAKKFFKYKGYILYKKEIVTVGGKKRTVYFFSKEPQETGEATQLPDGFEVRVNKKTGIPYLRKKK